MICRVCGKEKRARCEDGEISYLAGPEPCTALRTNPLAPLPPPEDDLWTIKPGDDYVG